MSRLYENQPLRRFALALICGASALGSISLAGCRPSEPVYPSAKLEGDVRIGAEPIKSGRVHFTPSSGAAGVPVTADIVDGRYVAEKVPLGNVVVTFTAVKDTGKLIREGDRQPYPELVNIIPGKYLQGIPLDVTADNSAQNFELVPDGT
jgi:hypothetical protein